VQQIKETRKEQKEWHSPQLDTGKTTTDSKIADDCYKPPNPWSFVWNTARIPAADKVLHGWFGEGKDNRYNGGDAKITRADAGLICMWVLARPTEQNTSAQTTARFKVAMERTIQRDEVNTGPITALTWNADSVATYDPYRASSFLEISLFDGAKRVVQTNTVTNFLYLQIDPDDRTNMVVLRPQRKWENDPR
jgi:hypothetical protein